MGGCEIGFEFVKHFGAAELGQEHVENDQVGDFRGGFADGFFAIDGHDNVIARLGESAFGGNPEKLTVFDEKDGLHIVWL